MKHLFAFLLGCFASGSWAGSITANYTYPHWVDYETKPEANGYVAIYGDSAYGTAISLSGSLRHNGDSALACFILRQNCPDNQPDSCYLLKNPHRCYVNPTMRGFRIGTTTMAGSLMQCPCWFQTWLYISNMRLHGHVDSLGHHLISDWFSPLTVTPDTTDNGDSVVTIVMDTVGYFSLDHVPLVNQQITTYQLTPANDTARGHPHIMSQGKWHLLQMFYDNHITHRADVWLDGVLHSSADVAGRAGGVAHFHFGMYVAPACSTGTVANDDQTATQVIDSVEGLFRFPYSEQ